jgi:hypothetical protein
MHNESYDQPGRAGSMTMTRLAGLRSVCRDSAIAYVGGLAIGAPLGLLAAWITRMPASLSACIGLAMVGVYAVRRKRNDGSARRVAV